MERVANQEWIKEMRKGNGLGGGRAKGMDSALLLSKRKRNRPDAAASLPPRPGADGSRVCGCSGSFCLSQELAE